MRDEITLRPQNTVGKVRVHIMANNFISTNDFEYFDRIKGCIENNRKADDFQLLRMKNTYHSNKRVEIKPKSIYDRKRLSKTGLSWEFKYSDGPSIENNQSINNEATLIKPQILLKRMKIRETSFDEQAIGLGMTYRRVKKKESKERILIVNPSSDFVGDASNEILNQNAKKIINIDPTNLQHNSFLNFLKFPCLVKPNLTPDENGNISFSIPSQRYANLYAIVIDDCNVTQIQMDLPSVPEEIWTKNMVLLKCLDPKIPYNISRKGVKLLKGGKTEIKDLTSVKYRIVDSLKEVKNIQLKIAKMDCWKINPDLFFLTRWNKLSDNEKLWKFNKYFSHEVNLFLYFKDKPFFNKVVKEFIKNKHEKSLIDLWLLGEYSTIQTYNKVEFFENLNSVEKILVIYIIWQNDQGKFSR